MPKDPVVQALVRQTEGLEGDIETLEEDIADIRGTLSNLTRKLDRLYFHYSARFPDLTTSNCPHCGARVNPQSGSCQVCQENIPREHPDV